MTYLLDTNICIAVIRQKSPQIFYHIANQQAGTIAISAISVAELQVGVAKSADPAKNARTLARFLAPLLILPFDEVAAEHYGPLRGMLERQGTMIGALDLLIAAHALSQDCTLVTDNEREFRRAPVLRIENWLRELLTQLLSVRCL